MANLIPTNPMNIEQELENLNLYKYHPSGILNVSLNRLQDMLDGKVELTDPSTPFTYLLETSCLNTAFAVQEYAMQTRKLYPRMANHDDDLSLHMSDFDYLGRFSEPSYANVIFNILFNDFKSKAVFDPLTRDWVLKLPRHLKVTISKYSYLLTSAIVIRMTENEIVDIKFENQDFNNIFPVQTNYINFNFVKVNHEETYLNFVLKLPEVDIEVADAPISNISELKNTISFNPDRQFYYFRAFHWKDGGWQEMLVTHTNEVYDVFKPTCLIKVDVTNHKVSYHIPAVYLNTNQVSGRVRFLVYTTMGKISVNFGDYQMADFNLVYGDVFPETELDKYTQPVQNVTKVVYTTDVVESGSNGKTFEELKDAVIQNSIGDRKLPITAKQLEYSVNDSRFKIVNHVDVLTNRIYKLETQIPAPRTRYPITKYNLDIIEYKGTISEIRSGAGVTHYGDDITVVPEGTIFQIDNGILKILPQDKVNFLAGLSGIALSTEVNKHNYLSLYYHYVIDTSNDTAVVRAYDLNSPGVESVNFREFNATARVGINTTQTNLYKTKSGYAIDLLTNLIKYNVAIDHLNITPYLVYTEPSGTRYYRPAAYYTDINKQPVFRLLIDSGYYINAKNRIHLQNFLDANGATTNIDVDIHAKLEIMYVSNVIPPEYVTTAMDSYINGSFMAGTHCVVSLEDISVRFGDHLQYLFAGIHTAVGYSEFETYEEDVPLRYTQTVYNSSNEVIHAVGDIVLDDDGNTIFQHLKGQTKMDAYQNPVSVHDLEVTRFINLLFIDHRALLTTTKNNKDYNQQIRQFLTEVITENAAVVHEDLLDNSQAFVVVPKTISDVKVKTGSGVHVIPSMQAFKVDVYVSYAVYNNLKIRENIIYTVTKTIDEYLHDTTVVKKAELSQQLFAQLREFVVTISLSQFTQLNAEYIELVDPNSRISLSKTLSVESDGYNLKEDIAIDFKVVD